MYSDRWHSRRRHLLQASYQRCWLGSLSDQLFFHARLERTPMVAWEGLRHGLPHRRAGDGAQPPELERKRPSIRQNGPLRIRHVRLCCMQAHRSRQRDRCEPRVLGVAERGARGLVPRRPPCLRDPPRPARHSLGASPRPRLGPQCGHWVARCGGQQRRLCDLIQEPFSARSWQPPISLPVVLKTVWTQASPGTTATHL